MKKTLILCMSGALVLTACGSAERDERQAYIDAVTQVTCNVNVLDIASETELKKAEDIWVKNGFDVAEIQAVSDKYKNDKVASEAINNGVKKCSDLELPIQIKNTEQVDIVIKDDNAGSESHSDSR